MAAFKIWASDGLTPHVEQGARGVCTLAVVASKCGGSWFGWAQIWQIQVILAVLGLLDRWEGV